MRKLLLALACVIGMQASAQEKMRITLNDGTPIEFSVNNIQEMSVNIPTALDIVGEWINVNSSFLTCYNFNADSTFECGVLYTAMDNQSMLVDQGTYTVEDDVIICTIIGNYTYSAEIRVVDYNDGGTELVASDKSIYYKVQPRVYSMTTTDDPISIGSEGDSIIYVDNCFIGIENNKIKPLKEGSGYALVQNSETKEIKAYRIDVEYDAPEVTIVDWTQYFKKSMSEIEAEFGEPNQYSSEKHYLVYNVYDGTISIVQFVFDDNFDKVTAVHVYFYDETKRQSYVDAIEEKYVLAGSTTSANVYYDTESSSSAAVRISISNYSTTSLNTIVYTDLAPDVPEAPVVDWTQYFSKSGDEIKAEFGTDPLITDDDEDEDYSMIFTNVDDLKRVSFSFNKGFEKVTSIWVSFKDASSMQGYCDAIAEKYILYSETETRKTYYDTDSPSTASVKVVIRQSSSNYITYTVMSE